MKTMFFQFDALLDILLKLRLLWQDFEEELWRLEELAVTGQRVKANTLAGALFSLFFLSDAGLKMGE